MYEVISDYIKTSIHLYTINISLCHRAWASVPNAFQTHISISLYEKMFWTEFPFIFHIKSLGKLNLYPFSNVNIKLPSHK